MKKIFLLCSLAVALLMASCASDKKATVALTGEWNIMAVDGQAVDSAQVEQMPYIGFDRVENRIYGNASCNQFFATLKLDSIQSEIRFEQAGATRMMCAFMETEDHILSALNKIVRFEVLGNGDVQLLDEGRQPCLLIRKK